MTVLSIIQEGLTNITKHSHAANALINLTINNEKKTLTIEDDGNAERPFAPTAGMGLMGIRERVKAVGGELNLENS